ncbi:hypothetical protein BG004_000115 [Podila humilis]|nr:hypothetical protein BG004_000115 [Podila humilis]
MVPVKGHDMILKIVELMAPTGSSLDQDMVNRINAILDLLRQPPENETPSRSLPSSPIAEEEEDNPTAAQEEDIPAEQYMGGIHSPASFHSLSPPGSPSLNSHNPFMTAPDDGNYSIPREPSADVSMEDNVTNEMQPTSLEFVHESTNEFPNGDIDYSLQIEENSNVMRTRSVGWALYLRTHSRNKKKNITHYKNCLGVYQCPKCSYVERPCVGKEKINSISPSRGQGKCVKDGSKLRSGIKTMSPMFAKE